MPLFTSFDDAYRWFAAGGELQPVAERWERLAAGRAQFLAVHAPLTDASALALAADAQDAVAGIEGVEPAPPERMHITLRGVGFQVIHARRPDDVLREDVGAIAERVARVLRGVRPIEVTLGPANVFPDALILEVHDGGPLGELRGRIGEAVAREDAFGLDEAQYLPHVTVATFATPDAGPPLRERLADLRSLAPVRVMLGRLELARWWFTGLDAEEPLDLDTVRSYRLR